MKNRAVWLAVSVVAIATLLMVFVIMPRLSTDDQPVGQAINNAGREVKEAVTQGGDAARALVDPTPDKAPAASAAGDLLPNTKPPAAPAETAKAERPLIIPTFDVLRVETDGSAVIAGRAEPEARLDVNDQTETVASTGVDKAGEFVAVLDKPLAPGDHQLLLKATTKDGRTVISEEIATVSVPQAKGGELLAMVTKPGEASRLITVPNINEAAKTERVALSGGESPVPPQPSATGAAPAPADPAKAADAPAAQQVASAPATAEKPDATQPTAKPELQVSAVEIEGDRIFVAGISRAGARLKAYADGKLIGDGTAGGDGHFVIDGIMPLSIGEHRIAVDQLGADGKVLVRVEVPFIRPAGDQVAAVATPQASSTELTPIDDGAFDKLRNEVSRAFQLLQNLYAHGATPSDEQVAAARSATSISLRSLSEYRLPADADANAKLIAQNTVKDAAAALKALDGLPRDVSSVGKGLGSIGEMIARAVGPVLPNGKVAPLPPSVAEAQLVPGARTIAQAPLTQSDAASVIIRRGDTLWQISRRVYGQGVRYTTIYLANQDQIANPDVIQPGQIFGVPKDAMPDVEAEKIHRDHMRKSEQPPQTIR
ncbi:LysM peptidoglycan-binding domain-containing protein [Rhizobium sp. CSW-27]|uniref:LysM peptidoglycan-binding domain-containing protein n=1 Tax=Rhizobium sp. CSW-27 TaxID=2839985 RepID=UPI001C029923|nr:LysM peptidoglycan-binding domain-containing protein [Rhizobium sp. CSW-27]MBT9368499.1 LysM peptidoglycan-binding domain-containing protein [Rhizobium sp. CSW-27]